MVGGYWNPNLKRREQNDGGFASCGSKKRSASMTIGERRRVVLDGLIKEHQVQMWYQFPNDVYAKRKKKGDRQVQRQRSLTECLLFSIKSAFHS